MNDEDKSKSPDVQETEPRAFGAVEGYADWRTVDTAPSNTCVLVCRQGIPRSTAEAFCTDGTWITMDGENGEITKFLDGYVTHWMPLPDSA